MFETVRADVETLQQLRLSSLTPTDETARLAYLTSSTRDLVALEQILERLVAAAKHLQRDPEDLREVLASQDEDTKAAQVLLHAIVMRAFGGEPLETAEPSKSKVAGRRSRP